MNKDSKLLAEAYEQVANPRAAKSPSPAEVLDLIKRVMDKPEDYIFQWNGEWEVTNEWLCGSFAGRSFTGKTPEEAAQQLIEYFNKHIGHRSIVGDRVTESGWPNLGSVESYILKRDKEHIDPEDEE
jgi:hypothetical protein